MTPAELEKTIAELRRARDASREADRKRAATPAHKAVAAVSHASTERAKYHALMPLAMRVIDALLEKGTNDAEPTADTQPAGTAGGID